MAMFDDALRGAVPGGNISKPLMIALGALLLGKMLGGSPAAQTTQPKIENANDSDVLNGLGSLVDKLKNGGLGDIVNSWIATGPNNPVKPGQLGSAIGQTTISDIARKAGVTEEELLAQLAQVLPQVVDRLTPTGRIAR